MKKILAASLLALTVAVGVAAAPAQADDTSSLNFKIGSSLDSGFKTQRIDWM